MGMHPILSHTWMFSVNLTDQSAKTSFVLFRPITPDSGGFTLV